MESGEELDLQKTRAFAVHVNVSNTTLKEAEQLAIIAVYHYYRLP